jgi:hypothetical protein
MLEVVVALVLVAQAALVAQAVVAHHLTEILMAQAELLTQAVVEVRVVTPLQLAVLAVQVL